MKSVIFNQLIDFIIGATTTGYIYLAGISAVIGAILPLTTIIFAQFYDKSAERSNELFWKCEKASQGEYG